MMQDEFKLDANNQIMNSIFERTGRADQEEQKFLSQYNLPQAIHSFTSVDDLPPSVWEKIENFQKQGALSVIDNMVMGLEALAANNQNLISSVQQSLDQEQQEDEKMRA